MSNVLKSIKGVSKKISKSESKISKSIGKKVDGPFDKYNLFESIGLDDHCWTEDGSKVVGPGIICWIVIFWIIISTVVSMLMYNEYKKLGLTDKQILIRYSLQILQAFLLATFVYSMCKRCRGLESILILILVTFIQGLISMGPFISKFTKEIKSLRGNGVLNNNNKKNNNNK